MGCVAVDCSKHPCGPNTHSSEMHSEHRRRVHDRKVQRRSRPKKWVSRSRPAGNQTATWAGAVKEREILYTAADQVKEIKSWVANHNTRFFYGPGRSRYKRLDTESATGSGEITTTHYVGAVEILLKPNGSWEKKRYIGGVLVITLNSDGGGSKDYLFTDHLGSTDVIAHRFGNVLQQMSFDAFGARRNPTASNAPTPWGTLTILQQLNFDTTHTTHGYTGHEGADKVGLIHMNGRMYDPVLGRFIQADSIVQDPFDPQSLNRYAYVQNNPLSATDPSGNISFKNALKLGVAIGITVVTSGASASLLAEGLVGQAFATAVAGGALAGAVTGGAKGALIGAFTSAAFFGVGETFASIGNAQQSANLASTSNVVRVNSAGLTAGQTVAKIAAHASVGGTMAVLQGGKFGHGFLTAGLNESVAGRIGRIGNPGGQIAASAILGGTTSSLVGGQFANGAITAAFATAFNEVVHSAKEARDRYGRGTKGTGHHWVPFASTTGTDISAEARLVFGQSTSGEVLPNSLHVGTRLGRGGRIGVEVQFHAESLVLRSASRTPLASAKV